jgi:hypothetical protein
MARIKDPKLAAEWIAQADPYTEFTMAWLREPTTSVVTRYMCRDYPGRGRRVTNLDAGTEVFNMSTPDDVSGLTRMGFIAIYFDAEDISGEIAQSSAISGFPVTVVTVTGERFENVIVLDLTDGAVILGTPGWRANVSVVRPAMWVEWDNIAWMQDAPLNNEETMS